MTIKQIIPAPPDLRVRRTPIENGKENPKHTWTETVVCLALCQDEDGDRIVAVTPNDCGCDWKGHFAILETQQAITMLCEADD
jgi:hypothetical protein